MSQQYWIGGFYIDLSRNQITQNKQSQTIPPKALSVLTYLANHQGKVVSQEELLSHVWEGTIVSPNTLQRSIAQLRKALGDDGKVQVYIKTHAKKGYSLECDVRWQEGLEHLQLTQNIEPLENNEKQPTEHTHTAEPELKNVESPTPFFWVNSKVIFVVAAFVIISLITFVFTRTHSAPVKLHFGELRSLTATDNKEHGGVYSPDGKFVVFNRYSEEVCSSNIWAKNLATQEETQLTKHLNTYGNISFSEDGKKLAFVKSQHCIEPVTQKTCFFLMGLDFEQALREPQEPQVLLECKNSEIRSPMYLNNNDVALLQRTSQRWQLISYSVTEATSKVLFTVEEGDILDYDYSNKANEFAITTINNSGTTEINRLTEAGQLLSTHAIQYPPEIAKYKGVYPNFTPFENILMFSTGRQLFTLDFDGTVTNVSLPIDQPIGTPAFHPNGKQMLVIKGFYDSDIVTMPLAELSNDATRYNTLERSTTGEDSAIIQPNSNAMAFLSARSGRAQIWLKEEESLKRISNFPTDSIVRQFYFSNDGTRILANVDSELHELTLSAEVNIHSLPFPIITLYSWRSENNTALAKVRINGVSQFVKIDLNTQHVEHINDKHVNGAIELSDGQIVYTDHMDRFWLTSSVEDEFIHPLAFQGSQVGFVLENDTLYGVNDKHEFWSYSLSSKQLRILGKAPSNIDYITDIHNGEVYMSVMASGKKEVAELTLKK